MEENVDPTSDSTSPTSPAHSTHPTPPIIPKHGAVIFTMEDGRKIVWNRGFDDYYTQYLHQTIAPAGPPGTVTFRKVTAVALLFVGVVRHNLGLIRFT